MTSSLPNLPAAPASTGAVPVNAAANADYGVATSSAPAGDFADLMAESEDAAVECSATASALPSFAIIAPPLLAMLTASAGAAESAEVAAAPETAADETLVPPAGISRDTMEQAASFLATILQSVLPEAAATPAGTANTMLPTTARGDAGPPMASAQLLEGTRPRGPGTADQSTPATNAAAAEAPAVAAAESTPASFEIALAADGAVEVNATLPPAPEQGSADAAKPATSSATATGAMEIQAELALPGRAVIRLSASGANTDQLPGRAKFAARIFAGKTTSDSANDASEINFLNAAKESLATDSKEAGITVAKTEATMKNTPAESTRATSNLDTSLGLHARGEFSVAWPSADRAGETAVAPLEKNFAERAVATVANLVDTQFNASMQKAGSVQLRLKFGGEDLSVRVELRGGQVHTDFRTDSPELRAALNREWQAVAGQSSESLRRFVEPVFSPSSSQGDAGSSFARQQAATQDQSQQQRAPRNRDEDTMTFTRRSLVGETFAPQPAAPRVPALMPTSLRLSVLA